MKVAILQEFKLGNQYYFAHYQNGLLFTDTKDVIICLQDEDKNLDENIYDNSFIGN